MARALKPHKVDDIWLAHGGLIPLMFDRNKLVFFADIAGERVEASSAADARRKIVDRADASRKIDKWYRVIVLERDPLDSWNRGHLSWSVDREEFAILTEAVGATPQVAKVVTRTFGSNEKDPRYWQAVPNYSAGKYMAYATGEEPDQDARHVMIGYTPELWKATHQLEGLASLLADKIAEAVVRLEIGEAEFYITRARCLHEVLSPIYYRRIRKVKADGSRGY